MLAPELALHERHQALCDGLGLALVWGRFERGAALSGGRGTVRGTMIGAFLVGFLVDGLVLVGVSVFWQQIIKGAVIILAVALDQLQQSVQSRAAVRRAAQASLSARAASAPAK